MKRKFLVLIICCQVLFAQNETTGSVHASTALDHPIFVVKIVRVKGDAEAIATLAGRGSGVDYQVSNSLKAIVLKGKAADVTNVENTIRELDNSSATGSASGVRNIELTVYVMVGSNENLSGFEEANVDALAPVLKQLRAIFPYKRYQLLSTILMRSAQNTGGGADGVIRPIESTDQMLIPISYRMSYERVGATTEAVPSIHVGNLQFSASVPFSSGPRESRQFQNFRIAINSNVDLREGQKAVVGTSNIPEGNTSVFVVLSARLVQ